MKLILCYSEFYAEWPSGLFTPLNIENRDIVGLTFVIRTNDWRFRNILMVGMIGAVHPLGKMKDEQYDEYKYYTFGVNKDSHYQLYYDSSNNIDIINSSEDDIQVQWKLVLLKDGTYKIVLKGKENYCVTIDSSVLSNGTNIKLEKFENLDNQKWTVTTISDNIYMVKSNANSECCMDEYQIMSVNNANIQIWDYEGNNRQQWFISNLTRSD